jgi:hypothetical protein
MDDTDKEKVTANLTTNLQKKVNKVFQFKICATEQRMPYTVVFVLALGRQACCTRREICNSSTRQTATAFTKTKHFRRRYGSRRA